MRADEERRPGGNRAALSNEQSQFNNKHTRPAVPSQPPSTQTRPEIARSYIRRNWATVPIGLGEKAPRIAGWPKLRITEVQTNSYFAGPGNVGVILGEASGGLVDVDLDCPEAVALAPSHLPTTDAVFGRESKPRSHWLYRVTGPAQSFKYTDPVSGETPRTARRRRAPDCIPAIDTSERRIDRMGSWGRTDHDRIQHPLRGREADSGWVPNQTTLSRSHRSTKFAGSS